jgi:hypothetical protein
MTVRQPHLQVLCRHAAADLQARARCGERSVESTCGVHQRPWTCATTQHTGGGGKRTRQATTTPVTRQPTHDALPLTPVAACCSARDLRVRAPACLCLAWLLCGWCCSLLTTYTTSSQAHATGLPHSRRCCRSRRATQTPSASPHPSTHSRPRAQHTRAPTGRDHVTHT